MSGENADLFSPGEAFHGYVVQKLLGRGGIGAVYLVKHGVLDTLYALKILCPRVAATDETSVKRFLREARLATRVRHPNLVAVHDCGFDEGKRVYYLVMDYVAGSSLREIMAFEGRLDAARATDIVSQVASALRAAQAFHVVHRDIKPENIMVQPDGLVKLVDLGIAKADNLGDSLRTNTDSIFGTPSYVSPEQAMCSAQVDVRADIYSLGIVFFEMLAGRCPYVGRNPAELLRAIMSDDPTPDVRDFARDVRPDVAVLVRRMTTKDLERRLKSLDALLQGLDALGLTKPGAYADCGELAAAPTPGMKTLLSGLGSGTVPAAVDPLANPDEDVRAFLSTRQRKERLKSRCQRALLAALGLLIVVALVWSLAR